MIGNKRCPYNCKNHMNERNRNKKRQELKYDAKEKDTEKIKKKQNMDKKSSENIIHINSLYS